MFHGVQIKRYEMFIRMVLPIMPTAQMRIRHASRGNCSIAYKAKDQVKNESQLIALMGKYIPKNPMTKPLIINIVVYVSIPQSKADWWREAAERKIILPISRPDIDNYIKQCLDIMEKMSYFNNDSQVVKIIAEKYYSIKPRWEITLKELEQPDNKKEYELIMRH